METIVQAGDMLRAFRKQEHLSLTQLAAKTQLVDDKGIGISVPILSGIEHNKRYLYRKYLKLLEAAQVFTPTQMQQLRRQAIRDSIRRRFGRTLPPIQKTRSHRFLD